MHIFARLLRKISPWIVAVLLSLSLETRSFADMSSATLSISLTDSSGALVSQADVIVRSTATNQKQEAKSSRRGEASFSFLKPGQYALLIKKQGFADIVVDGILLNVGDERHLQLVLNVGSAQQSITVDGSGTTINTTDASVSTVIDRKFVENTPLNGRSFQSLILLSPGTVTNTPQRSSVVGSTGEFSVNGQRTESNYYIVDGVSANSGVSALAQGAGASGSLPVSTALGTTQALVSVDALQEFRIESSTYSAEYGRSPGGQFSMVTRSGTNDWHGTAFNYFRNEALDANSWFNDNTVPITKKAPERQNDFGGTLGGSIRIPHLYNGKNRSFFFFSYEGLRLVQPTSVTFNPVPNLALRQSVSGALGQVLNAFPLPSANAPDLGNGLGEFINNWSNPSQVDATSIRLDHSLDQRTHLFFRFSGTPSNTSSRGGGTGTPSTLTSSTFLLHSYTFGATSRVGNNFENDFRLNYSSNETTSAIRGDSFGGAIPVDLSSLQGIPDGSTSGISLNFTGYQIRLNEQNPGGAQKQWNVVDAVNMPLGKHALKAGIDWRRLTPIIRQAYTSANYIYSNAAAVRANSVTQGTGSTAASFYPLYTNFSAYAQDEWRATPRLSVSAGIRWDLNPAPGVTKGLMPYTATNLNDLSILALAPQGTPLWKTGWYNFAPRLGVAYTLNADAERETVIRSGAGLFFDTGQQTGSYGFNGPGFTAQNTFGTAYSKPASFPAPVALLTPAIVTPPAPPYSAVYANPPHLQLPYTLQWNVSLEQALGQSQSFTVSYVGASSKKLLEASQLNVTSYNRGISILVTYKNGLTSNYNALQVKYRRQIIRGLQAIGSYTWAHNLDYGSYNTTIPYQYGNSDQDVRHNATAALSYDLPHNEKSSWVRALSSDWGVDGRFTARTGFPITLNGTPAYDPVMLAFYYGGLNLVSGMPLYLYAPRSMYPGGRRVNPAAFALPPTGKIGNAPRNFIDGFGDVQTDVAIRRAFPIGERLQGQFRAEAFNVFNHPNFGTVNTTYGNVQFGEATANLSQSLGTLSPLYQMGGPRSLQLTFKLTF